LIGWNGISASESRSQDLYSVSPWLFFVEPEVGSSTKLSYRGSEKNFLLRINNYRDLRAKYDLGSSKPEICADANFQFAKLQIGNTSDPKKQFLKEGTLTQNL
jgi:hypothetical protein